MVRKGLKITTLWACAIKKGGISPTWIRIPYALGGLNLIQIWRVLFVASQGVWFDIRPLSYIRRGVEKRNKQSILGLAWRSFGVGVSSLGHHLSLGISLLLASSFPLWRCVNYSKGLRSDLKYFSPSSPKKIFIPLFYRVWHKCEVEDLRNRFSWNILLEELLQF